jgi:hypothetical protein
MAFPFWWIGALTATLVLGAAFLVFGIAMRLVTRTTNEIRGSVLPGLVSGFRNWTEPPIEQPDLADPIEAPNGTGQPESEPATERVSPA